MNQQYGNQPKENNTGTGSKPQSPTQQDDQKSSVPPFQHQESQKEENIQEEEA